MQGRLVSAAAVACVLLAVSPVSAAPTLTYDLAVLSGAPGSTVLIGATLSLAPTDTPISTDQYGGGLSIDQQQPLAFLISPAGLPPDYYFFQNTSWTAPSQDPLTDLNVPAGGSVHLDLGSIVLGTALPLGDYTTDIGIYSSSDCPDLPPGESGVVICDIIYPYVSPPDFADAGLLTIVVTEVPEPAAVLLLAGCGNKAVYRAFPARFARRRGFWRGPVDRICSHLVRSEARPRQRG